MFTLLRKKGWLVVGLILLNLAVKIGYANTVQQSQINQKNVIAFYNAVVNQKDFALAAKYLGPHYVQHNPAAADGIQGLKAYIQFLKTSYPKAHSEIKRIISDDNYVVLQVHAVRQPGTRGQAIFNLFKLDHGKIVEHWDAIQDIPEKSANENGMF